MREQLTLAAPFDGVNERL